MKKLKKNLKENKGRKIMKKQELKAGMSVINKSGTIGIVSEKAEKIYWVDGTFDWNIRYDNNLVCTANMKKTIVKVFKDFTQQDLVWERKNLPQLSKDEICILMYLDPEYKYLCRDKLGTLYAYKDMPKKTNTEWVALNLTPLEFPTIFKGITWEDFDEPIVIDELIKAQKGEDENKAEELPKVELTSNAKLSEITLSVRAYNCLKRANMCDLPTIINTDMQKLLQLKGFGKGCAIELLKVLNGAGYKVKNQDKYFDDKYNQLY